MYHTLYFTFNEDIGYGVIVDEIDYPYVIDEILEDIVEYKYFRKYNKKYNALNWYLEPGAKDFVKDIEHDWFYNKLDTYKLYHDYDYIDFLKEKYYTKALDKCIAGKGYDRELKHKESISVTNIMNDDFFGE